MAWDYTEKAYRKQAKADPIWRLERLMSEVPRRKIDRELLKKYFDHIKISEDRRAFLELLLWGKTF